MEMKLSWYWETFVKVEVKLEKKSIWNGMLKMCLELRKVIQIKIVIFGPFSHHLYAANH